MKQIIQLSLICLTHISLSFASTEQFNFAEMSLFSVDGTEVRLDYDVVKLNDRNNRGLAKYLKVIVMSDAVGPGSKIHVNFYVDRKQSDGRGQVYKTSQEVIFYCGRVGYCEGKLNNPIELAENGQEYKHWMRVKLNGRHLIDPYRNLSTFRVLFNY